MTKTEQHYYSTKSWFPKQVPCVIVDGDYIPVDSISVLNIEEGPGGEDVITFSWKGEERKSFVVVRYN